MKHCMAEKNLLLFKIIRRCHSFLTKFYELFRRRRRSLMKFQLQTGTMINRTLSKLDLRLLKASIIRHSCQLTSDNFHTIQSVFLCYSFSSPSIKSLLWRSNDLNIINFSISTFLPTLGCEFAPKKLVQSHCSVVRCWLWLHRPNQLTPSSSSFDTNFSLNFCNFTRFTRGFLISRTNFPLQDCSFV